VKQDHGVKFKILIIMPNQELLNYIKQSLSQGYSKDQIKSALLKQGWKEEEIEEGLELNMEPKPQSMNKSAKILVILGTFILISLYFLEFTPFGYKLLIGLPWQINFLLVFLLGVLGVALMTVGFARFKREGGISVFLTWMGAGLLFLSFIIKNLKSGIPIKLVILTIGFPISLAAVISVFREKQYFRATIAILFFIGYILMFLLVRGFFFST